jgi:hypothetical protein
MKPLTLSQINRVSALNPMQSDPAFLPLINDYVKQWSTLSSEGLDHIALIRCIECTNGCVQYAFRDNSTKALSVEQTREAMKTSMSFIKTKSLTLPDSTIIHALPEIHELMDHTRELYIGGFKKGDPDMTRQFFAASVAQLYVCGKDRILNQMKFVKEHFTDTFTDFWLNMGCAYMMQYLMPLEG